MIKLAVFDVDAAEKAQIEINDQINQFIAKLDKASEDPDDFITMSELETEWRQLSHGTNKTYSDMLSHALSALDTKELNKAKKASSSRKGSV